MFTPDDEMRTQISKTLTPKHQPMTEIQEERKKVQYIVNLFIQTPYPTEFYLFLWQIVFFVRLKMNIT